MATRQTARRSLAASALLLAAIDATATGGIVGTGTPASCTEAAFDTVFFNAQGTGGGTITFNCGGAPKDLLFTNYKPVSANTTVDGGGLATRLHSSRCSPARR